ncbi:glutathione S-transferase family protein [Aliidiomarina maris]|uniref:Glutathione S-transferase n=1 Tax=Aliidiomarina maris TaxID=531312 RepID=A0A327WSD1_9GAMM|nr:glutathione S-transferase family protein [Aliidiomarina maris]RAJ95270.1 glutathione S-transferase [Aliidiomarina maris]RUO21035.1 glutathione S-transferase [Aliidiomarina maris]
MLLYEMAIAPNPRRVRMFLAEKSLLDKVTRVELDLAKGEHRTPEFAQKNPFYRVPVLELDNGSCIAETNAICRYMEDTFTQAPNLMGNDAQEKALVEQWLRWIDFEFMVPLGACFQHCSGYFKAHMNTFPDFGKDCASKVWAFFDFLDNHLEQHEFICADRFTIADINAYVTVQFAKVVDIRIQPRHAHLKAWHDRINSRASAKA